MNCHVPASSKCKKFFKIAVGSLHLRYRVVSLYPYNFSKIEVRATSLDIEFVKTMEPVLIFATYATTRRTWGTIEYLSIDLC